MSLGRVKYIEIGEFMYEISDYPVWNTAVKIKTGRQYFGKVPTHVNSRIVSNYYFDGVVSNFYFDGEIILQ